MGDEGDGDMPSPPAAKRLKRVAEVVMVLSAMSEMRGGRDPTSVEKAMAAEARESLTWLCEGFKPKDLFPREAVRAVVEDLGLNKDAGIGFRPPRASIAERFLQTKRELEGPKEVPINQYFPSQHVPVAFGASQMSVQGGGHNAHPFSSAVQTRRSQMNEKQAGIAVSSSSGATRTDSLHLKHNGMAYVAQSRAPRAANPQVSSEQKDKSVDHTSLRLNSGPHGSNNNRPAQSNEVKPPAVQAGLANVLIGLPAPQGITFVPAQSIYSSHAEISKKVQQIVQGQRDTTHPSWTPPSSEYMNKPLICQACNVVVTDVDSLLICDACERGTHLRCLESNGAKVQVPKAEWHCQKCLAASHGKALPPKYGKVTRTLGAAKVATAVRKENPQFKDDQKKTVPNGTIKNQPNTESGATSGNFSNVQVVSNNTKEDEVAPLIGTGVTIENHHSQNGQSGKGGINVTQTKESLVEKEKLLPEQHRLDKGGNQANGVAESEKPAGPEVCWVGDAGEVIDGKSYYSSCCINKVTYKLQDHVLVSSDGSRFIPSKIKSLWESKEPGSKWAVVNPCYLPSDLPESVSCSSGGVEDNEVYASDNKVTISVSLISGPCEVLASDRFQEENERRHQLADSNNLSPIFLCRWKYDDTNGILRPLTN